ncbi:MAG: choice-of-anchor D domain-containing protein [Candidatus Binataceae bacterium]
MRTFTCILFAACFASMCGPACAQPNQSSHTPAQVHFGRVSTGTTASATVKFALARNAQSALTVTGIATSAPFGIDLQSSGCRVGATLAKGASCTVALTFTPTAAVGYSGTLDFSDSAGDVDVALKGTGTVQPLSLSPKSIDFGRVPVEFSATSALAITNPNAIAVAVSSIQSNNPVFQQQTGACIGSIASLASCQLGVRFTPTQEGNQSGKLSITDGASANPQRVALEGDGTRPLPSPTATPTATATLSPTITATPTVSATATASPTATATSSAVISGKVSGGSAAVSGSNVVLYQAGTSGYGAAAKALGSAVSASDGSFTINFTIPSSDAVLHLIANGGNAGGGANPGIALTAIVGTSNSLPVGQVTVNEVTTIAGAWALRPFWNSGAPENIGTSPGNEIGLQNAAAIAAELANAATGTSPGPSLPTSSSAPVAKIDSLANALAGCVESVPQTSSACAKLFCDATAGASFNATNRTCSMPITIVDTLGAAIALASDPANNVASIFADSQVGRVFSPALAEAPNDWSIALTLTAGGLGEPTALAIDSAGDAWIANYENAVSEFSPGGNPLSPPSGFGHNQVEESFGIAIDQLGFVWITNEQSGGNDNAGLGTIAKMSPSGVVLSGEGYSGGGLDYPVAIAIDGSGGAWIADYGGNSITELDSDGNAVSPSSGYVGGGLSYPDALAVDGSGDLWAANDGSDDISEFSASGVPLSSAAGFISGGIDGPEALAIDSSGAVWIANYYGDSLTKLESDGSAAPGTPFTGGGLSSPAGVAVDGSGKVWITNYHGAGISEFSTNGSPLSPEGGFTSGAMSEPFAAAIDASGNLWTGNFANSTVTEFVGIATPAKTPPSGPTALP